MSSYDFDLAEDLRSVRGGLDSQAWLLNNLHNAFDIYGPTSLQPSFVELLKAARDDRDRAVSALDRLEARLREGAA